MCALGDPNFGDLDLSELQEFWDPDALQAEDTMFLQRQTGSGIFGCDGSLSSNSSHVARIPASGAAASESQSSAAACNTKTDSVSSTVTL